MIVTVNQRLPSSVAAVWGGAAVWFILLASVSTAVSQDTRVFPDFDCSYTLPGSDWKWLNPDQVPVVGKVIVFAKNRKGLGVAVWVAELKLDKTTHRFYEGLEEGEFQSGQLKKLRSQFMTFKSIPSYQIDASLSGGQGIITRAMCANGRLYCLQVMNRLGPFDPAIDTEAIFQGFNFVGQPRPMTDVTEIDIYNAFELGRRAGPGLAIIVGIVVLCVNLRKRKPRTSFTEVVDVQDFSEHTPGYDRRDARYGR